MGKFGSQTVSNIKPEHVVKSATATLNHENIPAFTRDSKSDLFLLGVTNFVSEDTFYEDGSTRDNRYKSLVHTVTKEDPTWVAHFVKYLRNEANMRSVAIVTAAEYANASQSLKNFDGVFEGPSPRQVINSACQRADEPAEVLAYWRNNISRRIPSSVKRGVADAARRLYNQKSFIKYDSSRNGWRWADVINLVHPTPVDDTQNALFGVALDSRYNKDPKFYHEVLPVLGSYKTFHKMNKEIARKKLLSDPQTLVASGMTWESLSSFGAMDKDAWEAVIPNMGYMALLRNLRNFDENKVSNEVADKVIAKLQDPEQVAKSRQLPFRFYSAYKNAPALRWGGALERALDESIKNVPAFKGRTLVLVDTSQSMRGAYWSAHSTASPIESAALFGSALAKSGQGVDLVMFADTARVHEFPAGGSTLSTMKSLLDRVGEIGWGTNIPEAIAQWDGHDRIILISDMQTTHYIEGSKVPKGVPVYAFNLQGYGSTVVDPEKNMYEFGGLTDNTFTMINALEAGKSSRWPWDE